jgi:hypothetical protein
MRDLSRRSLILPNLPWLVKGDRETLIVPTAPSGSSIFGDQAGSLGAMFARRLLGRRGIPHRPLTPPGIRIPGVVDEPIWTDIERTDMT